MDNINKNINEISIRRLNKVVLLCPPVISVESQKISDSKKKSAVIAFINNLESYGYTVSKRLFDGLMLCDFETLSYNYKVIISIIKERVGADKEYRVMYPNFPEQVREMEDIELIINACIHYLSSGTLCPEYKKLERFPLFERGGKLKVLDLAFDEDLKSIFTNLLESKTSLSKQDKADISCLLSYFDNTEEFSSLSTILPQAIPFKETVAYFFGELVKTRGREILEDVEIISKYFKTPTDVLRLAVALSNGDISLAENTKFKLKKFERKLIMLLLACIPFSDDFMQALYSYRENWIRLCEVVHPSDYRAINTEHVITALNSLKNSQNKPASFMGKLNEYISKGTVTDFYRAIDLLSTRPTEYARHLDYLLRESTKVSLEQTVVNKFAKIAEKVPSPVLVQLRDFYEEKIAEPNKEFSVYLPKGNTLKPYVKKNENVNVHSDYHKQIVVACSNALYKIFKSRPTLGNVYIDEEFRHFAVPASQRSASTGSNILTRFSHIPLDKNTNFIRPFVWWTNLPHKAEVEYGYNVDVDLSANIYNDKWIRKSHISYTNLKSNTFNCEHSGDIVNGGPFDGKGVSEFIDIDINAVLDKGCRYVVFQIYNFTNISFSNMEHCNFGWMERADSDSGEIFEPLTVKNLYKANSNSTVSIPVVLDCKKKEMIWLDINGDISNHIRLKNLESNLNTVTSLCKAFVEKKRENLYTLIEENVLANPNNSIVKDRNNADIIFSNDTEKPKKKVEEIEENGIVSYKFVDNNDVPIITSNNLDYFMANII